MIQHIPLPLKITHLYELYLPFTTAVFDLGSLAKNNDRMFSIILTFFSNLIFSQVEFLRLYIDVLSSEIENF